MAPLPRLSRDTTPLLPSSQQSCAGSFSVADSQWGHDLSAQEFHDSTTCSLSVCKNPDQCDSKDCCKDADCLVTLDSADRPLSAGNDDPEFDEYSSLFNHDQQDPLSCQWLLPGQPCAVSPPTLDALSDHVYHDHIQPQTQQLCQWNKCNDVVDPQELVDHLSHDHHLDAYVCLWQDCKAPNFSSSEALDEHIKLMHTKSFDCHWGGCEVANNDPGDLTTHVYQEHLNISTGQPLQYPNPSPHTGSSYNSNINSRDQTPDIPITSSNTTATSSQDANEASNLQIIHKCMWELGTGQSEKRDYCGESIFGTENDLQKHVEEQHTNEKSALGRGKGDGYICKWHNCARGKNLLRDRFSLNRHLYKHTGYYEHVCKHCSKRFAAKDHLENHERIHEQIKPFECDVCAATFGNKESLTIHKRTHTGEKPFECPTCNYRCADSSNMSKHRMIHEAPVHFCPECGKGFCRPSSLKRHMALHGVGRKRSYGELANETEVQDPKKRR